MCGGIAVLLWYGAWASVGCSLSLKHMAEQFREATMKEGWLISLDICQAPLVPPQHSREAIQTSTAANGLNHSGRRDRQSTFRFFRRRFTSSCRTLATRAACRCPAQSLSTPA